MNQKGQIIWQSFGHPTDTLLPTQTLTKTKSLISALRKGSLESGYFGLSFNCINVLTLIYEGPEISSVYWPSPDPGFNVFAIGRTSYNSSRAAAFNDLGVFNSSDRLTVTATDMGYYVCVWCVCVCVIIRTCTLFTLLLPLDLMCAIAH
ncbi:putative bulb-type lectin domain superfamily [Helianthus annuus]|nr:putative bulb-type lectin domain superfamily [Helianthus annuus]KAJ0646964.1 putative bulb-type lectin domain superfamily [Helianthus annuus]KAJ0842662.1 putative bulb-type lectin domain superfamily [Helianthus annuus]